MIALTNCMIALRKSLSIPHRPTPIHAIARVPIIRLQPLLAKLCPIDGARCLVFECYPAYSTVCQRKFRWGLGRQGCGAAVFPLNHALRHLPISSGQRGFRPCGRRAQRNKISRRRVIQLDGGVTDKAAKAEYNKQSRP